MHHYGGNILKSNEFVMEKQKIHTGENEERASTEIFARQSQASKMPFSNFIILIKEIVPGQLYGGIQKPHDALQSSSTRGINHCSLLCVLKRRN